MTAEELSDAEGWHRSVPRPAGTEPSEDLPPADAGASEPLPPAEAAVASDIQATREELGQTVEALAAKADVKARAREQARNISGRFRVKTTDAARSARSAAGPVPSRVKDRALAGGASVRQAIPEPARRATSRAATAAKDKRVAAAAAGGGLLLGCWLVLRRRRRS
jgi:Protein of unknown function (DUF3618)